MKYLLSRNSFIAINDGFKITESSNVPDMIRDLYEVTEDGVIINDDINYPVFKGDYVAKLWDYVAERLGTDFILFDKDSDYAKALTLNMDKVKEEQMQNEIISTDCNSCCPEPKCSEKH